MTLPLENTEPNEWWMVDEWMIEDPNDLSPGESGEADFNGARLSEVDAAETHVGDRAIRAFPAANWLSLTSGWVPGVASKITPA
jgi:hypothetical protein